MAIAASGGPAPIAAGGISRFQRPPSLLARGVTRAIIETPPLYTVTAAALTGDALGNFHFFVPLWIAVALTALSAGLFLERRKAPAIVTALVAIVLAATAPVHQLLVPMRTATSLARFSDDSTITVEGQIVSPPEHVEWDRTYIYVHTIRAGFTPASFTAASGIVRITIPGRRHFSVGDQVRATARIRFPRNDGNPGEFDYRAWLMRNGIAATMFIGNSHRDAAAAITKIGYASLFPAEQIAAIRERIGMFIETNLPYPEGAEMRALIIGDRGGVDEGLRARFALTGMAHLLVISGLHLGFVAAAVFYAVRLLMGFFPALMARGYANKFSAATGAIAVCAYASIAGGHLSTVRALIMVLAYAGAILIDRTRELLASLALAALVICLALPGSTADIGFQLSFASVCVILLGMRRFAAWWRWRYANPLAPPTPRSRANLVAQSLAGYIAVSFWALMGTAPLTAFHFNQFSLVGLVANVVVVPIMGFGAVVCGLAAAAMSFIWLPAARDLLWVAGRLAAAGTYLTGWFFRWPFAWVRIFTPSILELALAYGFLMLWLSRPLKGEQLANQIRGRYRSLGGASKLEFLHWRGTVAGVLTAVLITDAIWCSYQRYFNPDLRVTFLSVGEGDAAVVRFPGSRVMLIDGGGGFSRTFDPGERVVAPFLWSNKIMHVDYIALSHPDHDHFGGLIFIAQNFSPSEFWTGGTASRDESYRELISALDVAAARTRVCNSASAAMMIGRVTVRCVGPLAGVPERKDNNASMAIRLAYGLSSFLFSGDLEAKGERELIASGAALPSTILKVPHHGSHTSSSEALVKAVHPEAAVTSLGYHNRFHFPAPEVVARYKNEGALFLRTDESGAVSVDAEPNSLSLWTFRNGVRAFLSPANRLRRLVRLTP